MARKVISEAPVLPDSTPVITRDFDGWRVSLIRGGRVHTYLCDSKAEADRVAALLAGPQTDQKNRLRNEAQSELPTKK